MTTIEPINYICPVCNKAFTRESIFVTTEDEFNQEKRKIVPPFVEASSGEEKSAIKIESVIECVCDEKKFPIIKVKKI